MAEYSVLYVRPEEAIGDEALGSKTKFWFRRDGQRWLFKEARDGTGEDWAEKVTAEVASLVGVPAATVDLAEFQGRRGCASLSFVDTDAGEGMIHGNEIPPALGDIPEFDSCHGVLPGFQIFIGLRQGSCPW